MRRLLQRPLSRILATTRACDDGLALASERQHLLIKTEAELRTTLAIAGTDLSRG